MLSPRPTFIGLSDESQSCFGRVPTIVGTPGQNLEGTDGPDVVLSNGAANVDTLGGDDLVCVSGTYAGADFDEYHAGPGFRTRGGRDRIDTSSIETDVESLYLYVIPGQDRMK